jgi:GNAT superfamily N-acetyltransferase
MSGEELRLRPVAGKWSTLEVVCHIGDTEQFFADRMKRTLAMNRPLLVGADGWLYPEAVRYHDRDLDEELGLVDLTRRQMARVLKQVHEQAWGRTAIHTETGLVTLWQLLLHASRHLKHHVRFIEEKRQAFTAGEKAARSDPHAVARRGDFLISTDPGLLDLPLLHDYLANRSYWATGRPLESVRSTVENSLCFGVYEQRRQVGFARVVTDRANFAWLADVFVLETHRGRGLSKWLLACIMDHRELRAVRRFFLGTRDAHGLYEQYGFKRLSDPSQYMECLRSPL